ncbi:MAG: exosortase A [Thiotrichaceae bacterium]
MNAEQSSYNWRIAVFSVSALLLVLLFIHHETVLYLIRLWNDLEHGEYGHGYLILAVSGYLILRNRQALSLLTPCPSYLALLPILAISSLWILAVLVDVLLLQVISLLLFILTIVWAMFGNQLTRKLLFPILFIGFAIPIWFPLNSVLQDLSANVVFRFIRVLGIPAFLHENEIVLPAGTLSITKACSGLRYFLPGLALGALYGYLNYVTYSARLIVLLISAGAAVLVNIIRVFIVVYFGYVTDMQHPFVRDHLALGWYLFGGMVIILLVVDTWLNHHCQSPQSSNTNTNRSISCGKGKLQHMVILVSSIVLLSIGPVTLYQIDHKSSLEHTKTELEFPSGTGGWKGPVDSDNDWMPKYRGAITKKQAYRKDNKHIDLYIGYYQVQKQSKELIYYANRISNQDIWRSLNPKGRIRQTKNRVVLEQLLERDSGEQRLVWYWYRVAEQDTVNAYQAKALQALGLVTGNSQAYITAIAINCDDDITNTRKVLDEFLSIMEASLTKLTEQSHL